MGDSALVKQILEEKEKLRNNINTYRKYLSNSNVDLSKKQKGDLDKLYGTIIGTLFKKFYGYSSTNLKKVLKEEYFVEIPENEITSILDHRHLTYYLSMLKSTNKYFFNNHKVNIKDFISNTEKVAQAGFEQFEKNNNVKPIDELLNKYKKTEQLKFVLKKDNEEDLIDRNMLVFQVQAQKNQLTELLSEMPFVPSASHVANTLFGWYILYGIYGKRLDKIREDLFVDKDFNILPYMGEEHLKACRKALEKFNNVVSYKKDIYYSVVEKSLRNNAVEAGISVYQNLKDEIESNTKRRTSVYNHLLKTIKENMTIMNRFDSSSIGDIISHKNNYNVRTKKGKN